MAAETTIWLCLTFSYLLLLIFAVRASFQTRMLRKQLLVDIVHEVENKAVRYLNLVNAVREAWSRYLLLGGSSRAVRTLVDEAYSVKADFEFLIEKAMRRVQPRCKTRPFTMLRDALNEWLEQSCGPYAFTRECQQLNVMIRKLIWSEGLNKIYEELGERPDHEEV